MNREGFDPTASPPAVASGVVDDRSETGPSQVRASSLTLLQFLFRASGGVL